MENPKISVICLAFNHEAYIGQCIESILNQNTEYKFEIIIHDDCSTDKTAEIIKKYESKYPDIIRGIYESENQYSKGVDIETTILEKEIRGEYVSFCECDDYWLDMNRLQKQAEFLDTHASYSACHGNYIKKDMTTGKETLRRESKNEDVSIEWLINWGDSKSEYNIHESTIMYRRGVQHIIIPDFRSATDYKLALELSLQGNLYAFGDTFSVYRFMSGKNCWTAYRRKNVNYRINDAESKISLLKKYDELTQHKYSKSICDKIRIFEYQKYIAEGQDSIVYKEYRDIWSKKRWDSQLGVVLRYRFPKIYRLLKKISSGN